MTHATSGRVGSGRIGSGRVGSGRVGSGRVGSGRFTARSLKIEQGLPKNLVWKKTTWVLITVTYILKIFMTRFAPAKLALSPLSLFDTGMHERGL